MPTFGSTLLDRLDPSSSSSTDTPAAVSVDRYNWRLVWGIVAAVMVPMLLVSVLLVLASGA